MTKKEFIIGTTLCFLVALGIVGFEMLLGFCNMRGPHPRDGCDYYGENLSGFVMLINIVCLFLIFSPKLWIKLSSLGLIFLMLILATTVVEMSYENFYCGHGGFWEFIKGC